MNRYARMIAPGLAAALMSQAAVAGDAAAPGPLPLTAEATVMGLDGKEMGTVSLHDTPTGVLAHVHVMGVPAGDHGFHFHEKGTCDPADKFASAGAHFAAGAAMHGLKVNGGPHGGDMPNQHVGADGMLMAQVLNTGVTLAPGDKSLADADGSALVIHAAADDYTSQPAGNAGARIACAVIYPPKR